MPKRPDISLLRLHHAHLARVMNQAQLGQQQQQLKRQLDRQRQPLPLALVRCVQTLLAECLAAAWLPAAVAEPGRMTCDDGAAHIRTCNTWGWRSGTSSSRLKQTARTLCIMIVSVRNHGRSAPEAHLQLRGLLLNCRQLLQLVLQ